MTLAVVASACGARRLSSDAASDASARPDVRSVREAGAVDDAGRADVDRDAGAGAEADADAGAPYVDFAQPSAAVVYTNGAVAVQIATSSPPPAAVDVLVDGAATLHLTPPFMGSLPTVGLAEGSHALDCRALVAGVAVACMTRTVVVDRTRPTVIGTTPLENEYAAAGEPISAKFSEPMAATSVTATTFEVLADGASLTTSPTLSSDGRTLTSGIADHPARATGTAVVRGTITDLAGNALGSDATWTWRWTPDVISLGPSLPSLVGEVGGFEPSIAIGPDGLPVVAWTTEGTNVYPTRLVVQRWDGARWTMLASFPDQPTVLVLQLDSNVAIDRSGRVLVAWTDQDMGVGTFETRVRVQDGAGWDAWDDLPAGYRPHLVIDDAGNISVSMIVLSPSPHAAVFRRTAAGWQPLGDLMIPAGAQLSQTGGMAGDAAGTMEVEWCEQDASSQFVPRVRLWSGGTWQPESMPPAAGLGFAGLLVGMSRGGVAAFAWDEQILPMPSVAAVFVPGWPDRRVVDGFSGLGVLDIDVDPVGQPLVTLSLSTPRTLQVERWSGSAWEAVFDQIQVNPIPEAAPSGALALDDSGRPFVAVQERAGGHPLVYVVTKP